MESEQELKRLRSEQQKLTQGMSVLVLQSIIIFGVPAVCGYFVGLYLEGEGVAKAIAYTLPLLATFVLSWVILLVKLNRFKKQVEKIELGIQNLLPSKTPQSTDFSDVEEDLN